MIRSLTKVKEANVMAEKFLRLLNKENSLYAVLLFGALVYIIASYGANIALKSFAILFCMIMILRNLVLIYQAVKVYFRNRVRFLTSKDAHILLFSSSAVILILFFLPIKWRNFILIFCLIFLSVLFAYDLIKGLTKK